jgi:hypothetical protein
MRARNIKPGFFQNEDLPKVSPQARLLYIGLWLLADREGRLEDRPMRIRGELFRFEPRVNCEKLLADLDDSGFIQRYHVNGINYIQIPAFCKHQTPHVKERPSTIPAPDLSGAKLVPAPSDSLNPDSLNPVSPPYPPMGGAADKSKTPYEKLNTWQRGKFDEFWESVWLKIGKEAAAKAYKKRARSPSEADLINAAAKAQANGILEFANSQGSTPLYPATWLNNGRYADEESPHAISRAKPSDPTERMKRL